MESVVAYRPEVKTSCHRLPGDFAPPICCGQSSALQEQPNWVIGLQCDDELAAYCHHLPEVCAFLSESLQRRAVLVRCSGLLLPDAMPLQSQLCCHCHLRSTGKLVDLYHRMPAQGDLHQLSERCEHRSAHLWPGRLTLVSLKPCEYSASCIWLGRLARLQIDVYT